LTDTLRGVFTVLNRATELVSVVEGPAHRTGPHFFLLVGWLPRRWALDLSLPVLKLLRELAVFEGARLDLAEERRGIC
jgi:hypothetical protein